MPPAPAAGLELRLWVVDDSAGALEAELGSFGLAGVEAPVEQVELWRANGLGVSAIPLEELDGALAGLRPVGPRQTQWLGVLPEWSVLAAGPGWSGTHAAALDAGVLELEAGRLRLVGRAWALPPAPGRGSARLRIELAPQHAEARGRERSAAELGDPRLSTDADAGPIYTRLALEISATGERAFAVYPVEPPRPEGGASQPAVGPALPEHPSLGAVMLRGADGTGEGHLAMVLVLVPTVPERFGVLGP